MQDHLKLIILLVIGGFGAGAISGGDFNSQEN